ncbi:MAG: hypothetical protein ACRC51_07945 [Cetobacterium sp.]
MINRIDKLNKEIEELQIAQKSILEEKLPQCSDTKLFKELKVEYNANGEAIKWALNKVKELQDEEDKAIYELHKDEVAREVKKHNNNMMKIYKIVEDFTDKLENLITDSNMFADELIEKQPNQALRDLASRTERIAVYHKLYQLYETLNRF